MESRDFCTWLSGVLPRDRPLAAEETAAIRARLSDVFIHEIDPTMGDEEHQAALRGIHEGRDLEPEV